MMPCVGLLRLRVREDDGGHQGHWVEYHRHICPVLVFDGRSSGAADIVTLPEWRLCVDARSASLGDQSHLGGKRGGEVEGAEDVGVERLRWEGACRSIVGEGKWSNRYSAHVRMTFSLELT